MGIIVRYLNGKINYLALTEKNNNVKNTRYQLIGASYYAVLGENVFDPWLLRLAKILQQLLRIEEYASDVIFLYLPTLSVNGVFEVVRQEKSIDTCPTVFSETKKCRP